MDLSEAPAEPDTVETAPPANPVRMDNGRMIYGPRCAEWADANLFALTRDTRSWVTHDHNGTEIGDWYDTRRHLLTLYSLALSVCWTDPTKWSPHRPPQMLEIGVRHGIATMALLHAARESGGHLTSIEIDERYARVARERVREAKLDQWWTLIVDNCNTVIDQVGGLDLCWIDGDHSYAQTKLDVANYGSKVRSDGYIAMHDSANWNEPGVAAVVAEMRTSGRFDMMTLAYSYGLTIARVL